MPLQPTAILDLTWSCYKTDERSRLLEILRGGLQFDKTAKKNDLEPELKALSISKNEFEAANDMTRCVNLHKLAYLIMSSLLNMNSSGPSQEPEKDVHRLPLPSLLNNTWKAFEHGSYNTIFQFQEFSGIISNTISAVSSAVETTKISRLLKQNAPSNVFEILPKDPEMLEKFSDSNDYTSFPDYESTLGLGLENLTRFSPGPSLPRNLQQRPKRNTGRASFPYQKTQDTMPALWNILHMLYTAYDLASTIIQATKFLARKDVKAHKAQIDQNKGLMESAAQILEAVVEKSKGIKDGLDESGWIDRVLESMEVGGSGEQLRSLVGENFVEEWAGFVVEGWRESVTGLGLLKV
ncbi:hypothetical protein DID88_004989 [Monilinia fructigena]|uniref:Uncharacterized protein n=1 Tax=Monilinia fructigena TaxID=38457 RepID=A0A395ISQ8_9HELO|nr:hypothetical protein DID88_004989 [Monilinia fructigena]